MSAAMSSCPRCRQPLESANGHCSNCGAVLDSPGATSVDNWYLARGRNKIGPLDWSQLQHLVAGGQLQPTDMVLRAGTYRWLPAGSVPGLFHSQPVAADDIPLALPVTADPPASLEMGPTVAPSLSALSVRQALVIPDVPGYQIRGILGRGGMGVVYQAEQVKLKRTVALKMVLAGAHAGPQQLERFRAEAEAVARLQHPNIVQIHEIGEHQGLPYFSLEFCNGGSLADQLDGTPLPPRQAGELIETLARALQAAHDKGIIHRDLKPANILLTGVSGHSSASGSDPTTLTMPLTPDPWLMTTVPKITDFGLAKQLDSADGPTSTGAVLGTPSYMAPEQAEGKTGRIGPTADVYALGAILYELLTGRPPFKGATGMDTVMQVLINEPVPPSRLQPKVPRDLETICLKCLQKDLHKRYPSAQALADDLRRFLDGHLITARPAGMLERGWKWARRRPAVAALLAVSAAAAVALMIVGGYFTRQLTRERNAALAERNEAVRLEGLAQQERRHTEKERERAEKERERAEKQKAEADHSKQAAEREREEKARQLEHAQRSLFTAQVWRVAGLWDRDPTQARQLIEDLDACPPGMRDFAWGYYARLCRWERDSFGGTGRVGQRLALTADGKTLALTTTDERIEIWDLPQRRLRTTLERPGQSLWCLVFSPDGRTLATGNSDKTIRLWDVAAGKERAVLQGHTGEVRSVDFSPDGKWLVSGSGILDPKPARRDVRWKDGELRLWDVAAARQERVLLPRISASISRVMFTPDGQMVAAGTSHESAVRLLDVATGKQVARFHVGPGWIYDLAISPDGKTLAYSSANESVRVFELATRQERCVLRGLSTHQVRFSPDSKTIATVTGTVRLWDAATGRERMVLRAPIGSFMDAAFTPDGQSLVTAGNDGMIRLWATSQRQERATFSARGFLAVALSPDGKILAGASQDRQLKLWDLAAGGEPKSLPTGERAVTSLAFTSDGRTLVAGFDAWNEKTKTKEPPEVCLWDMTNRKPRAHLQGHTDTITRVALSADDRLLVTGSADGTVRLWNLAARKETAQLASGYKNGVRALAVTPDGQTIATAGDGSAEVKLWDVAGRRERGVWKTAGRGVRTLAFAPDGQTLAAGCDNGVVALGTLVGPSTRLTLPTHGEAIYALAFSPDGKSLAATGSGQTVQLWDPITGQLRAQVGGHTRPVTSLAFSRDSRTLISASGGLRTESYIWSGEAKLWDAAGPGPSRVLRGHTAPLRGLALSADGRTLASLADDRTVKLWDPKADQPFASINAHQDVIWALALARDGKTLATGSRDKTIKLWDVAAGRLKTVLRGHQGCAHCLAFSPDGRTLASGSCDATIKLWDVASGKETAALQGMGKQVHAIAFSPDGGTLAADGEDGIILLWDLASRRARTVLRGHTVAVTGLAFSPDGQTLASAGGDQTIRLWDVAAGRERVSLLGHGRGTPGRLEPTVVAFDPDGQTLVSAGPDQQLKVWDVAAGRLRTTLNGPSAGITGLTFLPDGQTLLAGGADRLILSWDLTANRPLPR